MQKFDPASFQNVISLHDSKIEPLRVWRQTFAAHAGQLADFVLKFHASIKIDRAALVSAFKHEKQKPNGSTAVFNPWDGWWSGNWHNQGPGGSTSKKQYHIWGPTFEQGKQYVQLVTQSETEFVGREKLKRSVEDKKVDLGINVWSSTNGVTGWVSKRQGGKAFELPHVGYSINPHKLIWIAQVDWSGKFYMFFEWVDPSNNKYGIHGRTFDITGSGIREGQIAGWSSYSRSIR